MSSDNSNKRQPRPTSRSYADINRLYKPSAKPTDSSDVGHEENGVGDDELLKSLGGEDEYISSKPVEVRLASEKKKAAESIETSRKEKNLNEKPVTRPDARMQPEEGSREKQSFMKRIPASRVLENNPDRQRHEGQRQGIQDSRIDSQASRPDTQKMPPTPTASVKTQAKPPFLRPNKPGASAKVRQAYNNANAYPRQRQPGRTRPKPPPETGQAHSGHLVHPAHPAPGSKKKSNPAALLFRRLWNRITQSRRNKIAALVILALALILVAFLVGNLPSIRNSSLQKHLSDGNEAHEAGDYSSAINSYKKALGINIRNIPAKVGLAKAYLQLGDDQSAETALREAIFYDRRSVEAYLLLCDLYMARGQLGRAELILIQGMSATGDAAFTDKVMQLGLGEDLFEMPGFTKADRFAQRVSEYIYYMGTDQRLWRMLIDGSEDQPVSDHTIESIVGRTPEALFYLTPDTENTRIYVSKYWSEASQQPEFQSAEQIDEPQTNQDIRYQNLIYEIDGTLTHPNADGMSVYQLWYINRADYSSAKILDGVRAIADIDPQYLYYCDATSAEEALVRRGWQKGDETEIAAFYRIRDAAVETPGGNFILTAKESPESDWEQYVITRDGKQIVLQNKIPDPASYTITGTTRDSIGVTMADLGLDVGLSHNRDYSVGIGQTDSNAFHVRGSSRVKTFIGNTVYTISEEELISAQLGSSQIVRVAPKESRYQKSGHARGDLLYIGANSYGGESGKTEHKVYRVNTRTLEYTLVSAETGQNDGFSSPVYVGNWAFVYEECYTKGRHERTLLSKFQLSSAIGIEDISTSYRDDPSGLIGQYMGTYTDLSGQKIQLRMDVHYDDQGDVVALVSTLNTSLNVINGSSQSLMVAFYDQGLGDYQLKGNSGAFRKSALSSVFAGISGRLSSMMFRGNVLNDDGFSAGSVELRKMDYVLVDGTSKQSFEDFLNMYLLVSTKSINGAVMVDVAVNNLQKLGAQSEKPEASDGLYYSRNTINTFSTHYFGSQPNYNEAIMLGGYNTDNSPIHYEDDYFIIWKKSNQTIKCNIYNLIYTGNNMLEVSFDLYHYQGYTYKGSSEVHYYVRWAGTARAILQQNPSSRFGCNLLKYLP